MITLWQFLSVCTGQHLCLQDINGATLAEFTDDMYERIKDIPVDRIIAHEDKIVDVRLGVTKKILIEMGYASSTSDYYNKYGKEYYYQHRDKILKKKHDKLVEKYKEEQNENTKK